jgi:hypothetical protein
MPLILGISGALMVFIGVYDGFSMSPESAFQQTVQGLMFVIGSLGLIVMGLGATVSKLSKISEYLKAADDRPKIPGLRPSRTSVDATPGASRALFKN